MSDAENREDNLEATDNNDMENILKSIREIIKEDDILHKNVEDDANTFIEPQEQESTMTNIEEDDDMLELEEEISTSKDNETFQFNDIVDDDGDPALANNDVSDLTAKAFERLERASRFNTGGDTLEDMVAKMMRPMLKNWINKNLYSVVETLVREEIARIASTGRNKGGEH